MRWREANLGSVATLQRGFDLPSRSRRTGPVPIVSSSGTSGWHDQAMVAGPGVITGRYGTIGEVFFQESEFWPLNTTLWVSNFHGNSPRFIYYLLQRIDYAAHKGKSGVPGVNRNDLHTDTVVLPASTVEQRSIADALDDVSDTISTLERLIAKKQAIKQGMMQQLLTGGTRLPGFSGSWRSVTFGELGSFFKGRGIRRDDVQSTGVPCIRYGELYTDFLNYTATTRSFVNREVAATALAIRHGDVLFAASGETKDEIGICVAYTGHQAVAGGDIIVLRGSGFNPIYLATLSNTPAVANQKARAGQGDAVVHINSRALAGIEVDLPSRREQDAITEVLVDADHELCALTCRLRKARDIKAGMMQQLLTGRTRLPAEPKS